MEIRLLEAFLAVADELHFGRAARRLGIAQPPLSQRVQRLERELDVRLFDRNRHGVSLTPAGTEILDHARRVVAGADHITRLAHGIRSGDSGTLRIGAVGSAFYQALPQLLAPSREQLPHLTLTVREMETPQQLDALLTAELDVGLVRPPARRGLRSRTVWQEPLVVALPSPHPLASATAVTVNDLAGEPLVLFPRASGPGYWDQLDALLRQAGIALEPAAEADHVTTMLGLVALGAGLGLVPASAQVLQLAGVRFRPLTPRTELPLAAVINPDTLTPAVDRFLSTLPAEPVRPEGPA
ncbi:LysR family transcriptional regulator [Streptomyces sp. NPDC005925]|uniref:LysR family transcriptional regulator n=1 Tax=Streptomyces sp. NPDC005925 TaxID=3157172 RepID=UPI0033C94AD6